MWDRQIEADSDTGKLDFLVADAFEMAGGRGFEPLPAESESAVLPLDEPPSTRRFIL